MLSLPITFISVMAVLAPVFSNPVWQHAKVLITSAILAPGRRTVTASLRVMGLSIEPRFQRYHRVLNRAVLVAPDSQSTAAEALSGHVRAVGHRRLGS
jgi:hypothetical protein